MDPRNIKKYAEVMDELNLSALEITRFGTKVRLERKRNEGVNVAPSTLAPAASPAPIAEAAPAATEAAASEVVDDPNVHTLSSPMIGAFYSSPSENQEPFVNVGDSVKAGDVLCIIESMKLMNEITSDVDGVILEVCAANSQAVDFGHPLFRIKKEA